MKKFPFKKINSFTDGKAEGAPAACVYLNGFNEITESEMFLIALELKDFVSEVVYLSRESGGIYLKYYSSGYETDFCGNGTIAMMYDLIKNDKELFNKDITQINVKNDTLDVYNRIKENDSIYVPSPLPLCHKLSLDNEEIADALRIDKGMIDNGFGLALIDAGLNTLIVPLFDLDSCLKILPERTLLKSYCDKNEIDIVLSFTTGVSDRKNDYRTRVFTPGSGYLEVPAEGSGSAAFGYYLLKKGLWNGNLLTLEQNGSLKAPNIIRLITVGNQVIYGGSAKVKISGEYIIS